MPTQSLFQSLKMTGLAIDDDVSSGGFGDSLIKVHVCVCNMLRWHGSNYTNMCNWVNLANRLTLLIHVQITLSQN